MNRPTDYLKRLNERVNQLALIEGFDNLRRFPALERLPGTVYLIEPEPYVVKIGQCMGNPESRLRDIQRHLYDKQVKLSFYAKPSEYKSVEKLLHLVFKHFRMKNEWFNLAAEDVVYWTKREIKWYRGEDLENDAISLVS